jgi:hypothetical protein
MKKTNKPTTASSMKTSFGKRKEGKHKKANGPKQSHSKPYKGQGR